MKNLFIILSITIPTFLHANNKNEEIVVFAPDNQVQIITLHEGGKASEIPYTNVKYNGRIDVSTDDKRIASMAPGAMLEISRVNFGNARTIKITADQKGQITSKIFNGRTEGDFSNGGEQWLAEVLPVIVKETTLGVESRVGHIYTSKGINGLLDEIDKIAQHSISNANVYMVEAIRQLELPAEELTKTINRISKIRSNSTKGSLLRTIMEKYKLTDENVLALLHATSTHEYNTERGATLRMLNPILPDNEDVFQAYFRIIDQMEIYSEKGNIIKHLLRTRKLTAEQFIVLLESTSKYVLEREKGAVLLVAVDYLPNTPKVLDAFQEVVQDIDEAYYVLKGEIMNTLAEKQMGNTAKPASISPSILIPMLETAKANASNSQKGLTLRKVNRFYAEDDKIRDAYFSTISSMDDNIEKYNVLLDLVERNKLHEESLLKVLNEAQELVSDDYQHAAGALLRACLKHMVYTQQCLEAFFKVVKDMDQHATIEEVLRIAIQDKNIGNEIQNIAYIVDAAKNIEVDIEKATLMQLINRLYGKDKSIAILTKTLESEYELDYFIRFAQVP